MHPFAREVQARRWHAQSPLDVRQRLVPRQLGMLRRNPSYRHRLRERRAVIGQIGLIPNERHRAGKALGAQRFRRVEAGERSAHDHDAPAVLKSGPGSIAPHAIPLCSPVFSRLVARGHST